MRLREKAICLRTVDYSETSQVVCFLTREHGLARLIAKGTKRPKSKSGGAIDLLAEGDLVFVTAAREGLGTLVEFSEAVTRRELRKDARRLNVALYMIELAGDMLGEADPHAEVFDLLHSALARLGHSDAPVAAVLAYFQWRLLAHVGLLGQLNACVACGTEIALPDSAAGGAETAGQSEVAGQPEIPTRPAARELYFSSRQGGLLCEACEGAFVEKFKVDVVTLAGLAAMAAAQAGQKVALSDAQAHRVSRLLNYHVTEQLARPLRMARHAIE